MQLSPVTWPEQEVIASLISNYEPNSNFSVRKDSGQVCKSRTQANERESEQDTASQSDTVSI